MLKQRHCKVCGTDVGKAISFCVECIKDKRKEYHKELNQRVDRKEKKKIYVKKYMEKDESIEKYKEYRKEYKQRPGVKEKAKAYNEAYNKLPVRRISYWKKSGIIPPEGNWDNIFKMEEKQNHCCKICGKHESNFSKKLALDHCHKTGVARGFLCDNCNQGIGRLKDDINIVKNAYKYLGGAK